MENTENIYFEEENIDIKKFLLRILKNWYWFAISLFITITVAYLINRYSEPIYSINSTIVVRDDSNDWLQTHYRFQIRTYWIGLLYVSIGVVFLNTLFSYLIFLFTFVWMIIRCTKGLRQLEKQEAVHNLESWLFTWRWFYTLTKSRNKFPRLCAINQ